MENPFFDMSPHDLIARALEEDHAAIKAKTDEASLAHHQTADAMRQKADELLAAGDFKPTDRR